MATRLERPRGGSAPDRTRQLLVASCRTNRPSRADKRVMQRLLDDGVADVRILFGKLDVPLTFAENLVFTQRKDGLIVEREDEGSGTRRYLGTDNDSRNDELLHRGELF